ncbi:MAG: hypothetical protein ACJ8FF_08735 [Sphingomicrobium sp.]
MRKFMISLTAAASALAFAVPASAQWAPPVYRYQPYNFGYGFSGINFARAMEARVQRIRGDIRAMEFRRILGRSEARSLDHQARNLQRRIYRASRFGISPGEARSVEIGIRRLEIRVAREASDWDRRPGHRRY